MITRRAIIVIALAVALDLIGGILFAIVEHLSIGIGLYWSVTTATTVGYGDISPHTTTGHLIAVFVMLTVIPLFAATFSLLTSGLTAVHVHQEGAAMKRRLDHAIRQSAHIIEHTDGMANETHDGICLTGPPPGDDP